MEMSRRTALAMILLFLIMADFASAWNFRELGESHGKVSSSPSSSPAPNSGHGSFKHKLRNEAPPPAPAKIPKKGNEICDKGKLSCKDTESMVACVQHVDEVNRVMVVLIQNDGESNLMVNIRTSSPKMRKDEMQVPKHHSKKTNISLEDSGTRIVLNAGSGDCTLQLRIPISKSDSTDWLPSSYNDLVTPIYGAYILVLVSVVSLAVFACCKFRSRTQDGIPYQELEMGETTTTATTTSAEVVADGWDQGWDDDWDDDSAIKSPGRQRSEIASVNGHASRAPNLQGWEDWDDLEK